MDSANPNHPNAHQHEAGASHSSPDDVFHEARKRGLSILACWVLSPIIAVGIAYIAFGWFRFEHLLTPGYRGFLDWWIATGSERRAARESLLPFAGVLVALLALPSLSDNPNTLETTERSVQQILLGWVVSISSFALVVSAWLVAPWPMDEGPWVAGFLVCAGVSLFASATFVITGISRLQRLRILIATQKRIDLIEARLKELQPEDEKKVQPEDEPSAKKPNLWARMIERLHSPLLARQAALGWILVVVGTIPVLFAIGQVSINARITLCVILLGINLIELEFVVRLRLLSTWHRDLHESGFRWIYAVYSMMITIIAVCVDWIAYQFTNHWIWLLFILCMWAGTYLVYPFFYHRIAPDQAKKLHVHFLRNELDLSRKTIGNQQLLLQPVAISKDADVD